MTTATAAIDCDGSRGEGARRPVQVTTGSPSVTLGSGDSLTRLNLARYG
jgi:hypothetical protein